MHKVVTVFLCAASLVILATSCSRRVCDSYRHTPDFAYPGANVAVVGSCVSSNAKIEGGIIGRTSQYKVIERSYLDAVLREQGLGTSGVLDPASLPDIGRISGVDALVITDCSGGEKRFRFVKTSTGEVLAAASYDARASGGPYGRGRSDEYWFVSQIIPWTERECRRESLLDRL